MIATSHQLGSAAQATGTAVNTAGTVATIGAQSGWWLSTAAVPVIGAAVAGVTLGLQLLFNRKGPQQKIAATKIVDQLEPLLKNNVQAYMSGPRTRSSQAAALKNFDDAWAYLTSAEACGNPQLGNPGKACISDRSRGGRWDWFSYYRDPIAQDPDVKEDPVADSIAQLIPGASAETVSQMQSLLPFALIALALAL
jgi:hypothetical protein